MYKAKVNCGILKQYLELLVQHKLVKEEPIDKKRVVYIITERGLTALKNVREINNALQIFEEPTIPSIVILSKSWAIEDFLTVRNVMGVLEKKGRV